MERETDGPRPGGPAAFGKAVELRLLSRLLEEGFEVYVPLVDEGVDAVVRWGDGAFLPLQIKATSRRARPEDAGLFAAIRFRAGCWYLLYAEALDTLWLLSAEELEALASRSRRGRGAGQRHVQLAGYRRDAEGRPRLLERGRAYVAHDLSRLREASAGAWGHGRRCHGKEVRP
ncbi:MAG: hypothetical protein D6809_03500 [Gammaproteobacteria bacterium]|nr:MAG: hypothetical protein D6809_03500 [Gammaproteobacteria bacterium]